MVLSLPWSESGSADRLKLSTKIGVLVDDLSPLPSVDVTAEKRIERSAMKVGENLFNFMQSFCGVWISLNSTLKFAVLISDPFANESLQDRSSLSYKLILKRC